MITSFQRVIHRHGRWIFLFLLGIIIVAFIFWDYAGVNYREPQTSSAMVYGHRINARELDAAKRMIMVGQKARLSEQQNAILETQILERMALVEKAQKLGLSITDAEVVAAVRGMPWFQRNNRFDENAYGQFKESLYPQRLTEGDFENMIRSDILVRKLFALIASTAKATPQQVQKFANEITQKVTASVCKFDLADFMGQVHPTEEQLRAFHRANPDRFRISERRMVAYVAFPIDVSKVKTTEEEVQGAYEQIKGRFAQNGMTKSLKDVADMLRAELSQHKARQQALKLATDFMVKVVPDSGKPPVSFDALARENKLEIKQTPFFSANDLVPGIPAPAFTAGAFRLKEEYPVSEPVEGPGAVYVLRLMASEASRVPPFDEARKAVVDAWTANEALRLARENGKEKRRALMALLEGGKAFDQAVASLGLKPQAFKNLSATDPTPNDPGEAMIRRAAFQLENGEVGDFIPRMTGGFFIYVAAREPAKPEEVSRIETEAREVFLKEQQERVIYDFQRSVAQEAQVVSRFGALPHSDGKRHPVEDQPDAAE